MSILYWIPKNLLSYWVGKLMHFEFPQPVAQFLIHLFARVYKIKTEEAALPLSEYKSIGAFFTRQLKEGVRPLASGDYVHPADSQMTARGLIVGEQLIQAKGRTYPLGGFLQEAGVSRWQKGFFITYYLCPTDYHRVHSPVEGRIKEVRYVPGNLWPVNDWSVNQIGNLFVKNERVIIHIETAKGPMAVVLVGATNVGSIRLAFEPQLRTNHAHKRDFQRISYVEPLPLLKGQELGLFSMGSTVIVVAGAGWQDLQKITQTSAPQFVQVGQSPE